MDAESIERATDALAFERLAPEQRGSGQFARAATPGLWRQNLSPAEQEAIAGVIGPKLHELGYDDEGG